MRTRTRVEGGFTPVYRENWTRPDCSSAFTLRRSSRTDVGELSTKSITDVVIPRFLSLMDCGEFLPFNPVTIAHRFERREAGTGDMTDNLGGCIRGRDTGPWWEFRTRTLLPPPPDEAIIQHVTNAAAAEAAGAVWDVLTFAAEIRSVNDLVRARYLAISDFAQKAANRAIRVSKKDIHKIPKRFSQYWLEYRYGWTPLILDAYSAVQALADKIKDGDIVNGTSSQVVEISRATQRFEDYANIANVSVFEKLSGTQTYRGAYYARVDSSKLRRFGTDPMLTAWELTPWSFVLDWFIDVNSYLQAISPFGQASLLGGGYSIKSDLEYIQEISYLYNKTDRFKGTLSGIVTTISDQTYVRKPRDVALPSWNPRLNSFRITDLIALFMGRAMRIARTLSQRR